MPAERRSVHTARGAFRYGEAPASRRSATSIAVSGASGERGRNGGQPVRKRSGGDGRDLSAGIACRSLPSGAWRPRPMPAGSGRMRCRMRPPRPGPPPGAGATSRVAQLGRPLAPAGKPVPGHVACSAVTSPFDGADDQRSRGARRASICEQRHAGRGELRAQGVAATAGPPDASVSSSSTRSRSASMLRAPDPATLCRAIGVSGLDFGLPGATR